jgi:hypothetical protein
MGRLMEVVRKVQLSQVSSVVCMGVYQIGREAEKLLKKPQGTLVKLPEDFQVRLR